MPQGIAPPQLTNATLLSSLASVGIITTPNLTCSELIQNAYTKAVQSYIASPLPVEKFDLEIDGTVTDNTTSASYLLGRIWKEFAPGDVSGMFKFSTSWRADEPFYPPQLAVCGIYGWIAYYQAPQFLTPPLGFGLLQNCALFAAITKKSPLATDYKTGITTWNVETQVTGPVLYFDGNGNIAGF